MRAATLSPTYSEFEDKIAVNGVYLVNRHELSEHQDKELQGFIDNHSHMLYFIDREKIPEPRVRKQSTSSNYGELSKKLPRAPSPFDAYKTLDSTFKSKKNAQPDDSEEYRGLPQPYIEGYNYITDFPGIEQPSDNQFLEDILKSGLVKVDRIVDISRPNSPAVSRSGFSPSPSPYNTMNRSQSQQYQHSSHQTNYPSYQQAHSNYNTGTNYSSNYGTGTGSQYGGASTQYDAASTGGYASTTPYASSAHYGSVGNIGQSSQYSSHYGTGPRGGGAGAKPPLPPSSPYSSLKRKGVSWVDQDSQQQRARSLSPTTIGSIGQAAPMGAPAYQRREVYSATPQGASGPTYTYSHTEFKLPPNLTAKQLLEYLSR